MTEPIGSQEAADNEAWTQGTRWATLALLTFADAIASLISPPMKPPLTFMFSPLFLAPAGFLFWLDIQTQPNDHGAKALTAAYWTGRPMPRWQLMLATLVVVILVGICLFVVISPAPVDDADAMPPLFAWTILLWSACYPLWYAVVKPRC